MRVFKKITLCAFILVTGQVYSQRYNWDYYQLKGKVKLVKESEYFGSNDKNRSGKLKDISFQWFNINGNVVKDSNWNYYQGHISQYFYKYDSLGRLIEEITSYSKSGKMWEHNTFYYENGYATVYKTNFSHQGLVENIDVVKHDDAGNLVEFISCDSNYYIQWKYLNTYDSLGHQTGDYQYTGAGDIYFFIKHKYDEAGNKTETWAYNADSSLAYMETRKFDEKGNETESCGYDKNEKLTGIFKTVYIYDKYGNWLKRSNYRKGVLIRTVHRTLWYYE